MGWQGVYCDPVFRCGSKSLQALTEGSLIKADALALRNADIKPSCRLDEERRRVGVENENEEGMGRVFDAALIP